MKSIRNRSLTLIAPILILALSSAASAQENLTNHALERPYLVSPAPVSSYADDTGPQAHAEGEFYRGELTDSVTGPANYRAAEWVGWRNTSYRDPITVEIDLGEAKRVDRVEARVCARSGNIEPPTRIDVALVSPDFPYEVPVQVAQLSLDEPWEPGEQQVLTFTGELPGLRAQRLVLDFEEPTWSYLFVDEIRVLGAEGEGGGLLPAQDFTVEAETLNGEAVEVEGAAGQAVLLDEAGETLQFEAPLPAGDYTIRVRSLAVEPDTFSEIELARGDQPMRPQAITNNVFTWQRSHFTQPEDGPAQVALTLTEGAGAYIDTVRIHELTLNQTITELYDFNRDTTLAADGEARCIIAIADDAAFADQAERIADHIGDAAGARPEIVEGDAVTDAHFRTTNVIALGKRSSNFAILKSAPAAWRYVPGPPEDGAPQIYVDVEPRGTGMNTVVLGGADEAQVAASTDAFLERLEGGDTLVLPWTQLPQPDYVDDREHYRQVAIESSKWLRRGAIRRLHRDWKYYADDTFLLLGYRYLEYLDSPDTIRQVPNDGFIDAETQKIVGNWNKREHHESFTDRERLEMTNLVLLMARKCKRIFDWNCCQTPGEDKSYHSDAEITRILQERPPMVVHNHQTFPAIALATTGDYYAKYYNLPEAQDWLNWAELFMDGPLESAKPMEDCWGYMDITSIHVARYAAISGRWDWFDRPMIYDFLKLRLMSQDNMGAGVGYGDVGGYSPGGGPPTSEQNAQKWAAACGQRLDLSRASREDVLGLYVHPLEPMYYDYYADDSPVALEDSFDKISFRDEVDPQAPYLLLDGVSGGYHGHWDGNSILRFTDNNRMWLCEGDYLKADPKDHNTLTIMRNAESGTPGLLSSLESSFDAGPWGASVMHTPAYTGLDWDRHLIFDRGSEVCVLFDEVTALQPGNYDVKARFRSLGETSLDDRTWHVRQQGEHFYLHAPGAHQMMEATDPEDAENWERYEFAEDTTPKLLSHRRRTDLQTGQSMVLPTVFYATSEDAPRAAIRTLGDRAIVLDGDLRAIAGVGEAATEALATDARSWVAGAERLLLLEATRLSADGRTLVEASAPVRLSIDIATGSTVVEADRAASLTVLGADPMDLQAGRHEFGGDFADLREALTGAWEAAWAAGEPTVSPPEPAPTRDMIAGFSAEMPAKVKVLRAADLTGDDRPEYLAGCEDGTLVVLDQSGVELWRHVFDGAVNDIAVGQVDLDGGPEIVVGADDSHVHVLTATGEQLWSRFFEAYGVARAIEGDPRAVAIADFEEDGVPEVAVAAANSFCYVLDNTGQIKSNEGGPWETVWRHKGIAIDAADLTGDGLKELICGYTYFSQRILDFTASGRHRITVVRSAKGGTNAIATADVDGDDLPEALYGDVDGQVTACTTKGEDDRLAQVNWVKSIGDDRVAALRPADLDGDGSPEIALASHSGFLALLGAGGEVRWVRYADNQVTDAAVVGSAIARTSSDGSLAVFDPSGDEIARFDAGEPLRMLAVDESGGQPVLVAAGDTTVQTVRWER
jgi:hypothetical protein